MSDTVKIALSTSVWTDVSGGNANGLITNESNYPILVRESTALPDPSDIDGHTVHAGPDGFFNWATITTTIYARATPGTKTPINVAVTRA